MTGDELGRKLGELRALPDEAEWVEFKHNNDAADAIGEYISALSNGAALHGKPSGWLIWGIENGTHKVIGTTVNLKAQKGKGNEDLEPWLLRHLDPCIDFVIHPRLHLPDGDVVMLEVPAAPRPVRFKDVAFIRVGSHKKLLREFPDKEQKLWNLVRKDWSGEVVEAATIADLDDAAIAFARTQFKKKNPHLTDEPSWDTPTFLNKAKVCIGGQVTRTALVLLGKAEAAHFISPAQAQVSWVLKDADGLARDYRHFGMPLILAGDELLKKIRNLTVRHLQGGTLFPDEVTQYDEWVIRETLHNCIAHQDYTAGARINVVETDDTLLFSNRGSFIPGTVEQMINADAPPDVYRNPFLAQAMVNLNMIDTIGSGIKRVFRLQRDRSFPMPDYELADLSKVVVRLSGQIIDENYTRLLLLSKDLSLTDVIALDKVQKKRAIDDETIARLRRRGLVEGRSPNVFVSAKVAAATGARAEFIKNRAFDKAHYQAMVVAYLEEFQEARLDDFKKLLLSKLSDALSESQKNDFIKNLLQDMRRRELIEVSANRRWAKWRLGKRAGGTKI